MADRNFPSRSSELRRASKSQKTMRKRACCVLLLSAVLFGIVFLMVRMARNILIIIKFNSLTVLTLGNRFY